MRTNPLEFLGVPKFLVVREYDQGRSAPVLKLAEAHYNAYAKQYHPDLPDGDADLMASFAEAISLLRDEVSLEMYIEEYIDGRVRQQASTQRADSAVRERNERAYDAALSTLKYVNQFEVLETTKPTSYFARVGAQKLVIEATSPSESSIMSSFVPEELHLVSDAGASASAQLSYKDGFWTEAYLVDYKEHVFVHNRLKLISRGRIIGSIDPSYVIEYAKTQPDRSFSDFSLVAGTARVEFEWGDPKNAWYLPGLVPRVEVGANIVVCNEYGRVASLGLLDAASYIQ